MIVLANCILKNVGGHYSRLQSDDKKLIVSVYHMRNLNEDDLGRIMEVVTSDLHRDIITSRGEVHHKLGLPENEEVSHYSKYIHADERTSFTMVIGARPSHFSLSPARADFPNARYAVTISWRCGTREVDGWYVYSLPGLSKRKIVILACEGELLIDEIYMVVQSYLNVDLTLGDGRELTTDAVNKAIKRKAAVAWHYEKVNLPEVISIHNGSALLEIVVKNKRNYFPAEK